MPCYIIKVYGTEDILKYYEDTKKLYISQHPFSNISKPHLRLYFAIGESTNIPQKYIGDWSREDYELTIFLADKLKQAAADILMDFFENPDVYTLGSSTIKDILLHHPDTHYMNVREHLNSQSFNPLPNSLPSKRIAKLKRFLDMRPTIDIDSNPSSPNSRNSSLGDKNLDL